MAQTYRGRRLGSALAVTAALAFHEAEVDATVTDAASNQVVASGFHNCDPG
jgi:hypothetical protein